MGYRDTFYCTDNIIGYTGALHECPTVYFFSPKNSAYGHITQAHGIEGNVGRERRQKDPGYKIENTSINNLNFPVGELASQAHLPATGKAAVEWRTDPTSQQVESYHTSRNLFVPVAPSNFFPDQARDADAIAILAIAIRRYPFKKFTDNAVMAKGAADRRRAMGYDD